MFTQLLPTAIRNEIASEQQKLIVAQFEYDTEPSADTDARLQSHKDRIAKLEAEASEVEQALAGDGAVVLEQRRRAADKERDGCVAAILKHQEGNHADYVLIAKTAHDVLAPAIARIRERSAQVRRDSVTVAQHSSTSMNDDQLRLAGGESALAELAGTANTIATLGAIFREIGFTAMFRDVLELRIDGADINTAIEANKKATAYWLKWTAATCAKARLIRRRKLFDLRDDLGNVPRKGQRSRLCRLLGEISYLEKLG